METRGFPFMALLFQAIAILVARPVARFTLRVHVRGTCFVPRGACVLAANHRSFLDPPAVGAFLNDPIAYFARASLWKMPVARRFLTWFQGIPVDRDNPSHVTMADAVDRLRRGVPVLVFPEGTRTRTGRVGQLRSGPALFARRAKVAVIPVYLHRTESIWPSGAILPRLWEQRLAIRYGRPVPPPPPGLPAKYHDTWTTRYLQRWMERQERTFYPTAGRR